METNSDGGSSVVVIYTNISAAKNSVKGVHNIYRTYSKYLNSLSEIRWNIFSNSVILQNYLSFFNVGY